MVGEGVWGVSRSKPSECILLTRIANSFQLGKTAKKKKAARVPMHEGGSAHTLKTPWRRAQGHQMYELGANRHMKTLKQKVQKTCPSQIPSQTHVRFLLLCPLEHLPRRLCAFFAGNTACSVNALSRNSTGHKYCVPPVVQCLWTQANVEEKVREQFSTARLDLLMHPCFQAYHGWRESEGTECGSSIPSDWASMQVQVGTATSQEQQLRVVDGAGALGSQTIDANQCVR